METESQQAFHVLTGCGNCWRPTLRAPPLSAGIVGSCSQFYTLFFNLFIFFTSLSCFSLRLIFGRQDALLSFSIRCGINCLPCYLPSVHPSIHLFIYYISPSNLCMLVGSSQGWHVEEKKQRPHLHSHSHLHPWAREIPRLTCLAWRATATWHSMKNTRWLIPVFMLRLLLMLRQPLFCIQCYSFIHSFIHLLWVIVILRIRLMQSCKLSCYCAAVSLFCAIIYSLRKNIHTWPSRSYTYIVSFVIKFKHQKKNKKDSKWSLKIGNLEPAPVSGLSAK